MKRQSAGKQVARTAGLDSLPYELLWQIFEAGGKEVIGLLVTNRWYCLQYRAWQLNKEFDTGATANFTDKQVNLRYKKFNQLYISLHFLSLTTEEEKKLNQSKRDSLCQQASTTLETYKKNHSGVAWCLAYLAKLHLNANWQEANKTKGLEYCKAAIKLNSIRACLLWAHLCEDRTRQHFGIAQIIPMAQRGNILAINALIVVFLHGHADTIKSHLPSAKRWNKRLNTHRHHYYDEAIEMYEGLPTASC